MLRIVMMLMIAKMLKMLMMLMLVLMMLLVLAVIHSLNAFYITIKLQIDDYDRLQMSGLPPPRVLAGVLLLLPPSVDRQVALFSFGPEDYLEGKDGGDDGGDGKSMDDGGFGDDGFDDERHY